MPMIKFEPTTSTSCVVGSDHSVNVVQQFLLFFKDLASFFRLDYFRLVLILVGLLKWPGKSKT